MADQYPGLGGSKPDPRTMTVMSFARGMKPTPSEISVATTAYTRTGRSMFEQEVPPVPMVPRVYARPYVEDDDAEQEAQRTPTPATPEPEPEPPSSHFPTDPDRQTNYDLALAHLEGTYIPPTALSAPDQACARTKRQHAEKEQKRFEHFTKKYGRRQQELEGRNREETIRALADMPAPLALRRKEGQHGREEEAEHVPELPVQYEYRNRPMYVEHERHPGASVTAIDRIREYNNPATLEPRATERTAFHPHIADPGCLDAPTNKLKGILKKAKHCVKGPPKITPSELLQAQIEADPKMKAAWAGSTIPGSRFDHSQAPSTPTFVAAPPPIRQIKNNPELEDPSYSEQTWNGTRTPNDTRKPLAPLISIEEAQRKFLGRPELSPLFAAVGGEKSPVRVEMAATPRPLKLVKVVGDSDRGTRFEDFINAMDLPETADEAFAEGSDLPASKTEESSASVLSVPPRPTNPEPGAAPDYAAEYLHAIEMSRSLRDDDLERDFDGAMVKRLRELDAAVAREPTMRLRDFEPVKERREELREAMRRRMARERGRAMGSAWSEIL